MSKVAAHHRREQHEREEAEYQRRPGDPEAAISTQQSAESTPISTSIERCNVDLFKKFRLVVPAFVEASEEERGQHDVEVIFCTESCARRSTSCTSRHRAAAGPAAAPRGT